MKSITILLTLAVFTVLVSSHPMVKEEKLTLGVYLGNLYKFMMW
jgi:hypothetical protein